MSEKIKCTNKMIHTLQTDLYYDFKRRNGYSELEIAQKREALENVLKPLTPAQNLEMLSNAGFKKSDMLFRWYNFACFIGIK
jgi:tRNA (cmo5U34)-methyltransferase